MLKRVLMTLVLGVSVLAIVAVATVAYQIYTLRGPLNSNGGQPPTSCAVETTQRDCQKLVCVSNVWYCDKHGSPMCGNGKCECFYGCL